MIPPMAKLTCALTAMILGLAGCGGNQPSPTTPEAPAAGGEAEPSEPKAEEPAAPESEAAEPETTPPEKPETTPEGAGKEPAAAPDSRAPKKSCNGLDKSTCEVTVGCAWHSTKKCISQ
jgi:hypothetical protein